MGRVSIRWSCLIAVFLCGLVQMQAQQGGTISGTVVDQAQKAIPSASVDIRNDITGESHPAKTDDNGRFSVTGLTAGTYSVRVAAPGFALATRSGAQIGAGTTIDVPIQMSVESLVTSITVNETISMAAATAPSGNTLEAVTARTEVSEDFIKNFMSPIADYSEYVNYAPGTFSYNGNGIGLGQGKTFYRGFSDGKYSMTFDGIPFEDTNDPTHHSWANFPSGWTAAVDFNRSPGISSEFGPSNFGGSINLQSPQLFPDPDIRVTGSYGSFNTRLLQLDAESGFFGPDKKNSFLMDMQQLLSDGYQTFNYQKRVAGYGKYQYRINNKSSLTLYGGLVDIWTNTPDSNMPRRDQVAAFGDNYLQDSTPLLPGGGVDPFFYGYSKYHVQTDFEYASYNTDLGEGWHFDAKLYTMRYWNKQFLQKGGSFLNGANVPLPPFAPNALGGVDKLNGYRHAGETAVLSKQTKWGIFRTGLWYEWAYTDRYQYPSNLVTEANSPLPNFHEHFITQTTHPFAEFEWHPAPKLVVTVGIKDANYGFNLNQYEDQKTILCPGGTLVKATATAPAFCTGNTQQFVNHRVSYNSWLPNGAARYALKSNWSVYAQFAEGSAIPPSAVFDVPGGNVLTPPRPTLAKTYQVGSVVKYRRWTLDVDAYYIHFQNAYASFTDVLSAEPVYTPVGPSNTKGIEAESNIILGGGFSLYLNGTAGSAKYQEGRNYPNGGLWVQNTPSNVETVSLLWRHKNFDVGLVDKNVGRLYNDNSTLNYVINGITVPYPVDQAVKIDSFNIVNVFLNYTIKNQSWLRGSKFGLAVNNLADNHAIIGVSPAISPTSTVAFTPNGGDLLNLLPGRSVIATLTVGWAPRR
jgi:iron complex outermembrane receptor protein